MIGCLVSMIFCQYSVVVETFFPSDEMTSNLTFRFTFRVPETRYLINVAAQPGYRADADLPPIRRKCTLATAIKADENSLLDTKVTECGVGSIARSLQTSAAAMVADSRRRIACLSAGEPPFKISELLLQLAIHNPESFDFSFELRMRFLKSFVLVARQCESLAQDVRRAMLVDQSFDSIPQRIHSLPLECVNNGETTGSRVIVPNDLACSGVSRQGA